tara:strand:+ start:975 stop:1319 length:345 start_codon:yes stop_codon:yes gene_type:complete
MSFLDKLKDYGRIATDFFSGDTARTIFEGAKKAYNIFKDIKGRGGDGGDDTPLSPPEVNLPGRVSTAVSRSKSGTPSFGDIQEASFYKYAQLQNTVRYLYSQKSRYKSIAKDKA